MPISTEDLSELPDLQQLSRICQSIAMLDAILQPEWDYRYFSYNAKWTDTEHMASMRDGSGSEYFMVFQRRGAILLGNTPHSQTGAAVTRAGKALPGTFDNVPQQFAHVLEEPAFPIDEINFCIWRTDTAWHTGGEVSKELNHSDQILFALDGRSATYKAWADEYYERDINLEAITQIYAHAKLTSKLVRSLNSRMTLKALAEDIAEIGF